ncbi:MAG TPA: class I SAM-dependent methyltransferase [Mycobacteriales bacterium]|nr:class I SAM-dependent methyltransferase [Mycobacteriales bacterium]HWA68165.1 class I SAM-dependent methyltransferase [Mycobacteriales bacterium]
MTDDPKVAEAWLDADSAADYERRRFTTLAGRLSQRLDFIALRRSLHGLPKSAPILDLPCGTGRALRFMAARGFRNLSGADVSPAMLAVAKSAAGNVTFVECDASKTNLPSAGYDLVFSMRFFGHVAPEDRPAILEEMARLSAGRVVIEIPISSRSAHFAKSVLRRHTVGSRLPSKFDWHAGSLRTFRAQAAAAGLEVVAARRKLPVLSDSRFVELRVIPR